jgi:hypothetical protein
MMYICSKKNKGRTYDISLKNDDFFRQYLIYIQKKNQQVPNEILV